MMHSLKSNRLAWVAALISILGFASPAAAYIGPGAGGGGPSGIGAGGWVVIIVAAGLGLTLLCGLIALAISASDRIKSWAAKRHPSESPHSSGIERPRL